jgi:hypothetical protein
LSRFTNEPTVETIEEMLLELKNAENLEHNNLEEKFVPLVAALNRRNSNK